MDRQSGSYVSPFLRKGDTKAINTSNRTVDHWQLNKWYTYWLFLPIPCPGFQPIPFKQATPNASIGTAS
jgi:hypothetical protein